MYLLVALRLSIGLNQKIEDRYRMGGTNKTRVGCVQNWGEWGQGGTALSHGGAGLGEIVSGRKCLSDS